MTKALATTAVLVTLLGCTAVHSHTVRHELEAEYANMRQALAASDLEGMMAFMAPDLLFRAPDGTSFSKDQIRAGIADRFTKTRHLLVFTITFDDLQINGNQAIVTYTEHNKAVILGADGV